MSKPLDLDKIEEELKQISPWPWRVALGSGDHLMTGIFTEFDHDFKSIWVADCLSDQMLENNSAAEDHRPNMNFIAKAPETIAALVKEMKSLQWKVDYYKRQLAGLGWKDNQILKRGSDEV